MEKERTIDHSSVVPGRSVLRTPTPHRPVMGAEHHPNTSLKRLKDVRVVIEEARQTTNQEAGVSVIVMRCAQVHDAGERAGRPEFSAHRFEEFQAFSEAS
jgi:hypothetical protein